MELSVRFVTPPYETIDAIPDCNKSKRKSSASDRSRSALDDTRSALDATIGPIGRAATSVDDVTGGHDP
jgi:hypothetical protein